MSNAPLFALARADNAIILTPQRNLSEFEFPQIEAEAAEIRGQISRDGALIVICDFSKIDFCGSTALGVFTQLLMDARSRGGEMAFCNLSQSEKDVLKVTRLDTLWPAARWKKHCKRQRLERVARPATPGSSLPIVRSLESSSVVRASQNFARLPRCDIRSLASG